MGRPGEVYGQLLGRTRVRSIGNGGVAPGIAWAELARHPDWLPQLGGLSGSPMLDRNGQVVGVLIASSDRRGRVVSAAPISMREVLDQAGTAAHRPARQAPPVDPSAFVAYGDALRNSLMVAKVACDARGLGSRRPTPTF
jgi:serine protease Do